MRNILYQTQDSELVAATDIVGHFQFKIFRNNTSNLVSYPLRIINKPEWKRAVICTIYVYISEIILPLADHSEGITKDKISLNCVEKTGKFIFNCAINFWNRTDLWLYKHQDKSFLVVFASLIYKLDLK